MAYSHWVLLTDRCVVIGCLLIDLMMLIDTYHSMIVRFTSSTTRHFLLPLLSLPSLFAGKVNLWDQGKLGVAFYSSPALQLPCKQNLFTLPPFLLTSQRGEKGDSPPRVPFNWKEPPKL